MLFPDDTGAAPPPDLLSLIPIRKTRAGLQFTSAAPTLGLIVCLYSVATGVAYFARKLTPLKSNTKINAAGYPVPRCSS